MTVLKARVECDICGTRKSMGRKALNKWESCIEIKRGFRIKPVDICPKCQKGDPPINRIFMRSVMPMDHPPNMPMSERYQS